MKIYTGFGDAGKTQLYGGRVVSKDHLRVEAYGTADELNSHLGLLIVYLTDDNLVAFVRTIQRNIFQLSAELATPSEKKSKKSVSAIREEDIKELEIKIDELDETLAPIKNFILPGGGSEAALTHLTRTVCRRLERRLVSVNNVSPLDPAIIVYINRLSDFLFVLARWLNKQKGVEDILWQSRK